MELALCTRLAGVITASGGLLNLLAWAQVPGLSPFRDTPPATGLCMLALGAAVHNEGREQRASARIPLACLLTLIGALTLLHYCLGWDTGLPRMLFTDAVRAADGVDPGYPALFTGIILFSYGLSLFLVRRKADLAFHPSDLCITFGLSILLLAWIGHLHGFPVYYATESGKHLSPLTAFFLLMGGAGLLCANPDSGITAILRDQTGAGTAARRLLPVPFVVPAFTAWLSRALETTGWLSAWSAQWLFSYANVLLYVLIIWRSMAMLLETNQRRRIAEEALQESYEKLDARVRDRTAELTVANATLRALIEASPLAIVALEPGGVVRIWNRAAESMLGASASAVLGKTIPAEPGSQLRSVLRRALHPEPLAGVEFEHAHANRSVRVLSAWSAPLRTEDNEQGLVLAFADLTEQRRLEGELRQSQKMDAIGQLAGGVAHDFNNLLTAIIGLSEVVHQGLAPEEPLREDVAEIKTAGERAAALTRQLLAFSRSQVMNPETMDLNTAVSELHKMLRRLIHEDIQLETALQPDLPPIVADRSQIEQIILNLTINARDAMPNGGALSLRTCLTEFTEDTAPQDLAPGRYASLFVTDSGVGMDEDTRSRIFEPFFTTKPQGKGTGLGLSTVYGIVRQSNAAILVDSEPGRGSTFAVHFPVAGYVPGPEPLRQFLHEHPRGTETVLLVEDEPAVRALARRVLTANGYHVLEAEDAAQALAVAHGQDGPIHLLLADVVMPHMGGRELAESLAMFYPDAKVLFMSGHTEDAIIRRGVRKHEIPFLPKPFTPDSLSRKVREVLGE